jgi:hypothetical protein
MAVYVTSASLESRRRSALRLSGRLDSTDDLLALELQRSAQRGRVEQPLLLTLVRCD